MTRKHASPTIRAIAAKLVAAEDVTQEQLQALWIYLYSENKAEAAQVISDLMTGSRLKAAVAQYLAADAIDLAEERLFDIKPAKGKQGKETDKS